MGEYFIIVNPRKKQYISPNHFDEGVKLHCKMGGLHAAAVGILISDCSAQEKARLGPLTGSWVGDPVILASDEADPNSGGAWLSPPLEARDNLYGLARCRFEPVSFRLIAVLSADPQWAEQFTENLNLVSLGYVIRYLGSAPLEAALKNRVGPNWYAQYRTAAKERPMALSDFQAYGAPATLDAARQLAQDDKGEFYWWVLLRLGAKPRRTVPDTRQTKIAGSTFRRAQIPFAEPGTGAPRDVLVQVNYASFDSPSLHDLDQTMRQGGEAIGVAITLEEPDASLLAEADRAGSYRLPGTEKRYPRIQILSVSELLQGTDIQMPLRRDSPQPWFNAAEDGSAIGELEAAWRAGKHVPEIDGKGTDTRPEGGDRARPYPLIVNPAKQQYVDPNRFPVGFDPAYKLNGWPAAVTGILICESPRFGRQRSGLLTGSWVGDPVIITSVDAASNPANVRTATTHDPQRNLFATAQEEYEDLTTAALADLWADDAHWAHELAMAAGRDDQLLAEVLGIVSDETWASQLAAGAAYDNELLVVLGDMVSHLGVPVLRSALKRFTGAEWFQQYQRACRMYPEQRLEWPDQPATPQVGAAD